MFSKVRVTDVVPAPEEPVIAMMGWRSDMVSGPEEPAVGEERLPGAGREGIGVVPLDVRDLRGRAEGHADLLVELRRDHREQRLVPRAGASAGLLHEERERVRLVDEPRSPAL